MSSIIPYDESIICDTTNLPVELVKHIVKMGDLCYIITKGPMGIEVRHFYTNQIIKTIETFTLLHISVSPLINGCIYVVGSNTRRIGIWNIYSSELITEFESSYIPEEDDWCYTRLSNSGEPTHTFTPNNNLLIASGYKIKVYTFESNMWVNTNTIELPNSDIIIPSLTFLIHFLSIFSIGLPFSVKGIVFLRILISLNFGDNLNAKLNGFLPRK